MQENNELLQEKINALGADTIMGSMEALNNDVRDKIEKLEDAVAESTDTDKNVTQGAITGDTLEAMKRMGYFRKTRPIVRDNAKIGRNDPCPCGSGEKYKNCCMDSGRFETTHYV